VNFRFFSILLLCLGLFAASAFAEPGKPEREGVGLQVVPIAGGELVVLQVVADSPAARAGLRPGDLLVRVGGRRLEGTDLAELSRQTLWGEEGSSVELLFLRPGVAGLQRVTLTREPLKKIPETPPGVRMLKPGANPNSSGEKP
jgi:carboxyl-terminal processing protease